MSDNSQRNPEDQVDYGNGEGAAYGGSDSDDPLFIPNSVEPNTAASNSEQYENRVIRYCGRVLNRIWNFRITLFSNAAGWNAFAAVVVAIATVFYTVYAHRQWVAMSGQIEVMREANKLTLKALKGSDITLKATLDKMQGQIDATNNLYREAQKQTAQAIILAGNAGRQATEMGNLATASEEANRLTAMTVEAQASVNRAILDVGKLTVSANPVNRTLKIEFTVTNAGPTRAKNISYSISPPNLVRWDMFTHRQQVEMAVKGRIGFNTSLLTGGIPDIPGKETAYDPVSIPPLPITNDLSLWEAGYYYLGKLDFDDGYGETWERKFCLMVGADTTQKGGRPTKYAVEDCNISGEESHRHPKENATNPKRK